MFPCKLYTNQSINILTLFCLRLEVMLLLLYPLAFCSAKNCSAVVNISSLSQGFQMTIKSGNLMCMYNIHINIKDIETFSFQQNLPPFRIIFHSYLIHIKKNCLFEVLIICLSRYPALYPVSRISGK